MFIRILCPIHFSIFSPALKNEDSADDILIFSSYNPTIALDVIRNEEGCELKAYRCSAGVWTIGYGHTAGVTEGMAISQAHAEELLRAGTYGFVHQSAGHEVAIHRACLAVVQRRRFKTQSAEVITQSKQSARRQSGARVSPDFGGVLKPKNYFL